MRLFLVLALLLVLAACTPPASTDGAAPSTQPTTQPTTQPGDEAEETAEEATADGPAEVEHVTPDDLTPGAEAHFGGDFVLDSEPLSLPEAIEQCSGTGELCRVKARVASVCQVRGCWFTIDTDATEYTVRVRMQDYAFFIPRNAGGAEVILEGRLTQRDVPQPEAQHYADDEAAATGEPAREVEGDERTWEFMATAVRITMAPAP